MSDRRFAAVRVVGALAAGLALLAAGGAAGQGGGSPVVQVTANELRLSAPLNALAADGNSVAFAFCNQLLGVWRPGARQVTQLGPSQQWSCPPPMGFERTYSLAFAGDRVAWITEAGGNIVTNLLRLVVLAQPGVVTLVSEVDECCRSADPDHERLGDAYGDGGFIAFSSRVLCGDRSARACSTPAQNPVSQTVWRLRRPPFQAPCVNAQGPCSELATLEGSLRPLSVDAGRVALRLPSGALEIRDAGGAVVRRFAGLAGQTLGAELMGGRLVALVTGQLREYSVSSGALVRTRPLPNVASGGVCGIPPCPPVVLRLLDAARGLVAYTLAGKLRLLRLRDGRDRVVASAADARFSDSGLFYAYSAAAPWVSRIRFMPWRALPVRP